MVSKCAIATYVSIDGNIQSVNGYVFGAGEKSIYIQGGIHGGEITYWIFQSLAEKLQTYKLNKQIILVPISNPFSWQQRAYFYTCGKFSFVDGKDWLWSFPGNKNGSPMQRLASQLFTVASSYRLSVDLHTSRKSVPFGIFSSKKYNKEMTMLGLPYSFVSNYGDSQDQFANGVASLSYSMSMGGKRGFTIECGSHDDFNEKNISLVTNSLLNLFRHEGVIDEPVKTLQQTHIFSDKELNHYKSPITGFVIYKKNPGESYHKDEELFLVSDSSDLMKTESIKASTDGVVLKISPTHIAQAGDVVVEAISHG